MPTTAMIGGMPLKLVPNGDGSFSLASQADGTREYNLAQATRTAFTSTSSAAVAIGTLGASRELMLVSTDRCYVALGASGVGVAAASDAAVLVLEAGERFHLKVPADVTHFRVIRDTTDGVLRTYPVA